MQAPSYSKSEFKKWILNTPNFKNLYDNWSTSGYLKELIPSVDRLDDYKPYTFDNIQLITWGENRKKSNLDRREGRNNKRSRGVRQFTKEGILIASYYSMAHAANETGVHKGFIWRGCRGKNTHGGGFIWRYAENIGDEMKTIYWKNNKTKNVCEVIKEHSNTNDIEFKYTLSGENKKIHWNKFYSEFTPATNKNI
jgi:hypothetical protein